MSKLAKISDRVYNNQRISDDDALFLFESNDLLTIGELAALVNKRKNGSRSFSTSIGTLTIPTSASTAASSARFPALPMSLVRIYTSWMRSETGRWKLCSRVPPRYTLLAVYIPTSPSSFIWRC